MRLLHDRATHLHIRPSLVSQDIVVQQLKLFGCRALQVAKPCLCQALRTLCSHRHFLEDAIDRAAAVSNEAEEDKEWSDGGRPNSMVAPARRPPASRVRAQALVSSLMCGCPLAVGNNAQS